MSLICDNKEEQRHVGFEHFNQERVVQYPMCRVTQIRECDAIKRI